jgi:Protein of unknown function (DUF4199)
MQNSAIRNGLLGSAVVVGYYLLLYVIQKDYFLNPAFIWAGMLIYILFMYKASKEDCALHGTTRDFREIVRAPFTTFLLLNLAYWLLYYALHLFDPALIQMEIGLETTEINRQLNEGMGDPEQANILRERLQMLEKMSREDQVQPLTPIISRMLMGALGGFAIAAAIAAIMRSEK